MPDETRDAANGGDDTMIASLHHGGDAAYSPDPHGFDLSDAPTTREQPAVLVHRRSIIEEAKLCYEAHCEQMLLAYPHLRTTPWDDQDAAVREAWIEHITPEERRFA